MVRPKKKPPSSVATISISHIRVCIKTLLYSCSRCVVTIIIFEVIKYSNDFYMNFEQMVMIGNTIFVIMSCIDF